MTDIWLEAKNILKRGEITSDGLGNDRKFYSVAGMGLQVHFLDTTTLLLACTCKHCSIFSGFDSFCSRKAALITYLRKLGLMKDIDPAIVKLLEETNKEQVFDIEGTIINVTQKNSGYKFWCNCEDCVDTLNTKLCEFKVNLITKLVMSA